MSDPEQRNDDGYPLVSGPATRPRARVQCERGGAITGGVQVDQRVDHSNNKALPWFSATAAGLGFGGLMVLSVLQPWRIEDRAAQAELRAEFAQKFARLEVRQDKASSDADLARDFVDRKNAELKQLAESKRK